MSPTPLPGTIRVPYHRRHPNIVGKRGTSSAAEGVEGTPEHLNDIAKACNKFWQRRGVKQASRGFGRY